MIDGPVTCFVNAGKLELSWIIYLKFQNAALLVEEISDGIKWDQFVEDRTPQIAFEVQNDKCMTFMEGAKLALHIEAAAKELLF